MNYTYQIRNCFRKMAEDVSKELETAPSLYLKEILFYQGTKSSRKLDDQCVYWEKTQQAKKRKWWLAQVPAFPRWPFCSYGSTHIPWGCRNVRGSSSLQRGGDSHSESAQIQVTCRFDVVFTTCLFLSFKVLSTYSFLVLLLSFKCYSFPKSDNFIMSKIVLFKYASM
jgi:hypothetical protein